MKDAISCKQAVDYISKKEEGKLSSWKRLRLWRHLTTCDLCRRFSAQNKILATFLSVHKKKRHHLPEAQKKAIAERILDNA
jgi:predicted anti-sigma-YlaC factor YlaD